MNFNINIKPYEAAILLAKYSGGGGSIRRFLPIRLSTTTSNGRVTKEIGKGVEEKMWVIDLLYLILKNK